MTSSASPRTTSFRIKLIRRIGDRFASIKRRRDPFSNCLLNSDSNLIDRFATVLATGKIRHPGQISGTFAARQGANFDSIIWNACYVLSHVESDCFARVFLYKTCLGRLKCP
jgi:hypothetical protein